MNRAFLQSNIIRFNNNAKINIGGGILRPWISEIYCFARYGCSPDDYFRYEFYRKSHFERNKFITYGRSQKLIKQYNNSDFTDIFHDKVKFNQRFSGQIGREWMKVERGTEFEAFVQKHGEVLIKPQYGGQGHGIFKLTLKDLPTFNFDDNKDYVAEQFIKQHPIMAELNASSVNTVRVLTFKGRVVACALRIGGAGALVDNLHSNGVCAHLDVKTGMIDSPCINNRLEKFLFHPDSKMQLVGFRVPNWEKVITAAEEAATVVPQVQYIGWDIAVTENGTALIEGNHDPGHDVVQMIAQTGLYLAIKKLEAED